MNSDKFRNWPLIKMTTIPLPMIFIVIVIFLSIPTSTLADYRVPIGIPDPSDFFGTFDPIDDPAPTVDSNGNSTKCPNWPEAENSGCYYVDNTVSCSYSTYGSPDNPRCTIPEGNLNAGEFVYIAGGGTYVASGSEFDWDGIGTASNPIWITGDPSNPPTLNESVGIASGGDTSYLILQHFKMSGRYNRLEVQPGVDGDHADHIVVRHFTMTGTQEAANYTPVLIAWSQSGNTHPNSTVNYTVIYDGTISGYGDKATTDEAGVYLGYHTDYAWVLGCDISNVGADSIAGSHYTDNNTMKAEHYFIGDNVLYGNGENGIDLKGINHAVISENTIYGPFTREQGWGIILHYGATPSTTVKDVWVLFNQIYHVSGGIYTSGSVGADDMHIIGNIIYDVDSAYAATADSLNGHLVFVGGGDGDFSIVDNTFYDYEKGLLITDLDGTDTMSIHGNIFHNRSNASEYEIEENTDESKINMDYNQFFPSIEAPAFRWGGAERTLSYMKNTASKCANCDNADPMLINPPVNLNLQTGSPCIDINTKHDVYDRFFSTYSVNIERDIKNTMRPQDNTWEIGAYEVVSQGTPTPVGFRAIE